ncbi:MAG: hypothetical protein ABIW83_01355 [Allosphingosinicella sp.]
MSPMAFVTAAATYLVIAAALAAGIAASYGRELEANRRPDGQWWIRRLLITPLQVIAATAATELFGLSKSGAAFTAAMLSIGGYDVIKLIESRWLRRVGLTDGGDGPGPPRRSGEAEAIEQQLSSGDDHQTVDDDIEALHRD